MTGRATKQAGKASIYQNTLHSPKRHCHETHLSTNPRRSRHAAGHRELLLRRRIPAALDAPEPNGHSALFRFRRQRPLLPGTGRILLGTATVTGFQKSDRRIFFDRNPQYQTLSVSAALNGTPLRVWQRGQTDDSSRSFFDISQWEEEYPLSSDYDFVFQVMPQDIANE